MSETLMERVLELKDVDGVSEAVFLHCHMDEFGHWILDDLYVPGLNLTTAGVSDSDDKRFVTDLQLAALDDLQPVATDLVPLAAVSSELVAIGSATFEQRLARVSNVDLNTTDPTVLYTVPTGKYAFITRIVIREASIHLTTASFAFGFVSADYSDLIADGTHTELVDSTNYTILTPKVGAVRGSGLAGDILNVKPSIAQGEAATVTVEVFGYLEDIPS